MHCTRTIPSKAECSHTTPQQPSAPMTNYTAMFTVDHLNMHFVIHQTLFSKQLMSDEVRLRTTATTTTVDVVDL